MPDELPPLPLEKKVAKPKGYLNPELVKGISFYIIIACVILSVFVSILKIWDFTKGDVLWRLIATFLVVGVGTAVFSFVNGIFGSDK